jgi:hypothetical protein
MPDGFRYVMTVLAAGAIFAVLFSDALRSAAYGSDEAAGIVSRVIEVYGGKRALSRVASFSLKGRIVTFMPEDEGSYSLALKRGRKLLVNIIYRGGRTERRILNGDRGYRGTGTAVETVAGLPADAMVYQYDQMYLPFGLAEGSLRAGFLRRESWQDRMVDVLEIKDRQGTKRMEASVDVITHRIVRTSATFGMGGAKAVLSAEFSGFRTVRGILFPFVITNYAGDFRLSVTRISSYSVGTPMNDALFAP